MTALADLHAYVDDCVEPAERRAFEAQMAENPALARRVAIWREQNDAIRSAFDFEGARAFPISIGRQTNEVIDKRRRPAPVNVRLPRDPAPSLPAVGASGVLRIAAPFSAARRSWKPLARWLALVGLSACFVCLWPAVGPGAPSARFGEAGVAAFRAFVSPAGSPAEFATRDLSELQRRLAIRLSRPIYLPQSPSVLNLVDARIAPAPGATAAFLVYEMERRPIGLLIQPLDGPPTRAPEVRVADGRYAATWTCAGQGFVLVGDIDAASLLKIATDFFETQAEPAQFVTERGS